MTFAELLERFRHKETNQQIKEGSHSYYILLALSRGEIVDDYGLAPKGANGYPIRNVPKRIFDLRHKYGVPILSWRENKVSKYALDFNVIRNAG